MNNKKHIVNIEYFREMLQICPRIPNQPFDELPFKEEILAFLRELVHSGEIKMIIDEDFVYQAEHKDAKKSNEMYYPRFIKVIVNFFMNKDQSIPRRNKVNWHFARDDHMLTTIKLVSRHQNTQQYGAILPIELTNEAIRNSKSYKEYYAIASGAEPPNTKASVKKKKSSSDTTMPPPSAKGKILKTSAKVDKPTKEKQSAKTSKAKGLTMLSEVALTEAEQMKLSTKRSLTQTHISHASGSCANEGTSIIPGVPDVPTYESDDEEISWKSSEDNDDDEVKISEHDDDVDDQIQTPSQVENTEDEDNDKDSHGMNIEGDEGANKEDDGNELYGDLNINLEGQQQSSSVLSRFVLNMLNLSLDTGIDSIFDSTLQLDVPVTTTAEPPLLSATTLPLPSIPIISHVQQTPAPSPAKVPSSSLLRDESQAENEDFLNKLNENVQKIIKEQVKEQVKAQTAHAVDTDLSELELKKILIDKMESNKPIHRSDEQKNLYKALIDAYECDKLIDYLD
nr:hypothetical protein [Tanacetum cinerariifolium]